MRNQYESFDLSLSMTRSRVTGRTIGKFAEQFNPFRPRWSDPKAPPLEEAVSKFAGVAKDAVEKAVRLARAGYKLVQEHAFLPNQYFLIFGYRKERKK